MIIKYVYSAGDSFVFGDELLEEIRYVHPDLLEYSTAEYPDFKLHLISKINEITPDKAKHVCEIKDVMTLAGQVAYALDAEHINFAQPGASIDNILIQVIRIIDHIKTNNRDINDCLILVGTTSPWRKPYFSVDLLVNKDITEINFRLATSGSLLLAEPEYSIWETQELAKFIGKHFNTDQLNLEWCMRLASIHQVLLGVNAKYFKLINMWQRSFLNEFKNEVMRNLANITLTQTNTLGTLWPAYPLPLTHYAANVNKQRSLPNGHPDATVNHYWSKLLLIELEKDGIIPANATANFGLGAPLLNQKTMHNRSAFIQKSTLTIIQPSTPRTHRDA